MQSSLNSADLQLQYQNVKAPVSGVVFDPKVRAKVLQPGERILSIVPQEGLYAEVFVPNQDIGFADWPTGKVSDAFPFTRYGEISAAVIRLLPMLCHQMILPLSTDFPLKLNLESLILLAVV